MPLRARSALTLIADRGQSCIFAARPIPAAATAQWRALSLFCGGGGLDLGFLEEGIHSVGALDMSAQAVATYNRNFSPVAKVADLSQHTPDQTVDVLLAGAPCQGFSTAGKRDLRDPRNALLNRISQVARLRRPKVVVVENVPAAMSGGHRAHWLKLEASMAAIGYNVRRIELKGEESGLAQRRRRLFMICWRGSDCIRLDLNPRLARTVREALLGAGTAADHAPRYLAAGSVDARVAARIRSGEKLCNVRASPRAVPTWLIPDVFGETSEPERDLLRAVSRLRRRDRRRAFGDGDPVDPVALNRELGRECSADVARLVEVRYLRLIDGFYELKHTYNGKYRRLEWDGLSPTVDTHFGRAALFLHPEEDRGLTIREAARIQGFPDDYRVLGNRGEQFEIVGNAVPPPMGARVAEFVREAILKA